MAIEVERIDFVSVPTRDLERARRFYRDTLGLRENTDASELETANVTLALWSPEAEGEAFAPNTAGIAVRVPDVAEARRELEEAGVLFPCQTGDTGPCPIGFCYHPDGKVLL